MKFALVVVLASILTGASARTAGDALRAIETAELTRTLDAGLVAALDDEPASSARAALAIGRTKDIAGAAPLRAHLKTSAPGVRAMSAYGLGLLGDASSLGDLIDLARGDRDSAVRFAAIDAVGRILANDPRGETLALANDMLIVARADADPVVRAHGVAQLDVFRASPFAHVVAASLQRAQDQERDETVRWHTGWTISRAFASVVDSPFLSKELHDRNELVRAEAARAWGRRGGANAAALLGTVRDDPSWRVQLEVREALLRLAHRPPTEHLIADPPGLHLPRIAAADAATTRAAAGLAPKAPTPAPTRTPGAFASPSASATPKLTAPDPARIDLASPVLATQARDLTSLGTAPHPRIRIVTTKGTVTLRLAPEWAPSTVANFLSLADRGYFDGNRWFRIVPDFVVQTGDPNDNGEGDAGYTIPAEENPLEQSAGIIAMGLNYDKNKAIRDSAGTQFYLTLSPQLHLDRDFSVFGVVSSGFEVLAHLIESDRIVTVARISDG